MRRTMWALGACLLGIWTAAAGQPKVVEYATPTLEPVVFSAESKAEGAGGASDACLWLDVHYSDGTATWGTEDANKPVPQGTHDWVKTTGVFHPKKPIRKIEFSALFRGAALRGKMDYRNLALERREAKKGEVTSDIFWTDAPYSGVAQEVPGVAAQTSVVWTADSMAKVTPLTFPDRQGTAEIALELAANERESAQICVTAGRLDGWDSGSLQLETLRRRDGTPLAGSFTWQRIGYVPREAGGCQHSFAPPYTERWMPDPLLPAAPFKVRAGSTQGLWLTVYADASARAGEYAGSVKVLRRGYVAGVVRVKVRVRGFALPKTFAYNAAFSVMDGFTRLQYPADFRAKKRESWDVMLDHRLSPDDISRFTLPDIEDVAYAKSRGMNHFNLLNVVPEPADPYTPIVYTTTKEILFSDWFYPAFRDRLKPYVAVLRARGLLDGAYIYGFDEQEKEYFPAIEAFWKNLQRDVPGVPLMSTSKAFRALAKNPTNPPPCSLAGDWFCPLTSDWDPALARKLQAQGKKVWWYTCCGPLEPYANFASIEFPFSDARVLGWQTYQVAADGFLFWIVNFWGKNQTKLDETDTYFPNWSMKIGNSIHGDGILMYPGTRHILPSIRLANVRDGVEDAEWLMLAERKMGRAAVLKIVNRVAQDATHFTHEPQALRAARSQIGDALK